MWWIFTSVPEMKISFLHCFTEMKDLQQCYLFHNITYFLIYKYHQKYLVGYFYVMAFSLCFSVSLRHTYTLVKEKLLFFMCFRKCLKPRSLARSSSEEERKPYRYWWTLLLLSPHCVTGRGEDTAEKMRQCFTTPRVIDGCISYCMFCCL